MKKAIYGFLILLFAAGAVFAQEQLDTNSKAAAQAATTPVAASPAPAVVEYHAALEDILIPVIAILSPFVAGILIVFFVVRGRNREKKQLYDLSVKYLEHGKEVPYELIYAKKDKDPAASRTKRLLASLTMFGVGLACFIGVMVLRNPPMLFVGTVFVSIGIAQFIVFLYEKKQSEKNACDKPDGEDEN